MQTLLSEQQRIRFLEAAFKRNGSYYCWPEQSNNYSGKDLPNAKHQNVYDCSGLVTCSLYEASGLDRRSTWNAQKLMKNCGLVQSPEPGDLCFYGSSPQQVSHVMVYIGTTKLRPKQIKQGMTVYGASGGDRRTKTPELAREMDASVKAYRSHKYRPDFLFFGRLVTKDE